MKIFSGSIGALLARDSVKRHTSKYETYIRKLYLQYKKVGCHFIKLDTFDVNPLSFSDYRQEIAYRRSFIPKTGDCVYLSDIGPLGVSLEPLGETLIVHALDAYYKTFKAHGDTPTLLETFTDLRELRVALIAWNKTRFKSSLFVSMSFTKEGKTPSGDSLEAYVNLAEAFGVFGVGLNCNLTAEDMIPLAKRLVLLTHRFTFVQPNKSCPHEDGTFDAICEDSLIELASTGVSSVGGCCGYEPSDMETVKKLTEGLLTKHSCSVPSYNPSSSSRVAFCKSSLICGDRLNVYGSKQFREALSKQDFSEITKIAMSQIEGGADILDVCVDTGDIYKDCENMRKVLFALSVLDIPVQIDSSSEDVIKAGLLSCTGVPIINSAKPSQLSRYRHLAEDYGALLIQQIFDDKIDKEYSARSGIFVDNRCILDLQVLSMSEGNKYASQSLELIKQYSSYGSRTMMGLSNISYGLPDRDKLNAVYLIEALNKGIYEVMCNPSAEFVRAAIKSWRYIHGLISADDYVGVQHKDLTSIYDHIVAGVLPSDRSNVSVDEVIKALDKVGELYETHVYYLPQLVASANVAKSLLGGSVTDGSEVLMATVKGDIHDIGKNIVISVAQANGFKVKDLGHDVEPSSIVSAVTSDTKLIGLSGLLTTSIVSMRDTIDFIRKKYPDIKILIGGAAMNQEIANRLGVQYSDGPLEFVSECRKVFKR